jgi:hypothetical protein
VVVVGRGVRVVLARMFARVAVLRRLAVVAAGVHAAQAQWAHQQDQHAQDAGGLDHRLA